MSGQPQADEAQPHNQASAPEVRPSPQRRSLVANQEAQVTPAGTISVRTVADAANSVAWRDRRLVFRQETLARIVIDSFAAVLGRDGELVVDSTADAITVHAR